MSDAQIEPRVDVHGEEEKPLPGWICAGVGIGFIVLIAGLLVAVRVLSG